MRDLWHFKEFNINDNVWVQLTPLGRQIHKQRHEDLKASITSQGGTYSFPYIPIEEDVEGWSKWQLWVLEETFGEHQGMGSRLPYKTTIRFEKRDLREVTA